MRIVFGDAQRVLEMHAGVVERGQRRVDRLDRRLDQRRRLRAAAFEPAHRGRERRHRGLRAGDGLERDAQVFGDLFRLHHAGAPFGERGLFAGFRRELAEFLDGVAQPFGLALRALDVGAVGGDGGFARAPLGPQPPDLRGLGFDAAIGVDERAVRARLDEGAVGVLAVDFHQRRAERAQRLDADRLVVDEGAGAAVGELHPAHDHLVVVAEIGEEIVVGEHAARRMLLGDVEDGGHLTLLGALAHQRGVAAGAERQGEGIEQDRFAGAGLAGQHRETGPEIDVQPIDQDDIADGKADEHEASDTVAGRIGLDAASPESIPRIGLWIPGSELRSAPE